MKKMIKRGFLGALLCCGILTSTAQQLPNYGFESWKSSCGSSEAFGTGVMTSSKTGEMRQRPGVEPTDWSGSSVNQKVIMKAEKELISNETSDKHTGSSAVKIKNAFVGVVSIGSNAPGYITLGTPWVYAVSTIEECDGGTYGGASFTARPDAITGWYKRTDSNNEVSHIIVYLWNGTFTSKVGSVSSPGQSRNNVDRAVMGRITPTSSGTLIASCDYTFSNSVNSWTEITVPLTYHNTTAKPAMMNTIISAADYWTRSNVQDGTTLLADDVKFLYYSRLSTLSVGGVAVEGFAEGTYNYTIDGIMPANPNVNYTVKGMDATAEVITDNVNKTITVVVTNASGADADGETSHTYTIKYNEPKATVESVTPANGATDVKLEAEVSFTTTLALQNAAATVNGAAATVAIDGTTGTITFDKAYSTEYTISLTADNLAEAYTWSFTTVAEPIIEYYNGDLDIDVSALGMGHVYSCSMIEMQRADENSTTCDFYLRDFSFAGEVMGDIIVPNVEITENNGVKSYYGYAEGSPIIFEIPCNTTIRGTEDANGNTQMTIDVVWAEMPINVVFDGQKINDGLRLSNLTIDGVTVDGFDAEVFNYFAVEYFDHGVTPVIGYTKADANATVSVEVNHFAVKIWVEKDGKSNFYSLYDGDAYYTGVELPAEIEGNLIIEGKRVNSIWFDDGSNEGVTYTVYNKEIAGVERVLGSVIYDMPMIDGTAHYGVGLPFEGGSKYAYTVDGSEYDITDETSRETAYALVYTEEFDTNANGETIWQHTDRFTMAYQRFDLAHMAMWGITDDEVTSLRFVSEAGAFGAPVAARAAGTGMDTPALYGMVANNGLTSVSVSELDATASEVYIINAEGTELVKADDVNTATIQPFGMAIVYRGEAAAAPASIAIEESSIATGIEGVTAGDMRVYAAEGNIYVKGYTGEVAIFTINGAQVCTVDVADNATIAMAQGMYIVRTGAQATMVVVK